MNISSTSFLVAAYVLLMFHVGSGAVISAFVNLPCAAVVAPIVTLLIVPVVAGLTVIVPVPVGLNVIV